MEWEDDIMKPLRVPIMSPRKNKRKKLTLLISATVVLMFVSVVWYVDFSRAQHGEMSDYNSKVKSKSRQHNDVSPQVLPDDIILKHARTAFVIPEYKLIFFTFPKVACSEWKRMFMRINGNPNWCKIRGFDAHDPKSNLISTLADYSPEIATEMMTSPSWTRAAFVREPKERVLSAFLDKSVKEDYIVRKCCNRLQNESERKKCKTNRKSFESFLYFVRTYPNECFDVHWEPQVVKIDKKWWPYIDFIGHQENLLEDAERLLRSLTSSRDPIPGRTAWERYGITGWGDDNELCEKRPNSFLKENTSTHKLDTGSHMLEWYTKKTEKMVEETWAVEWQEEKIEFPLIKLFADRI